MNKLYNYTLTELTNKVAIVNLLDENNISTCSLHVEQINQNKKAS